MNQNSLQKTLRRKIILRKTSLIGWCRVFNAPFGEYAFLNLKKTNKTIWVAYFCIRKEELELFKEREAGSNLIEVKKGFFAFVWAEEKSKYLPVLRSYIDICEKGAKKLAIDFWRSTKTPKEIVDDRNHPFYL